MVELKSNRNVFRGLIAGATLALTATQAMATEGYFQLGFGPRQNAVGGAGVADSRDAMSAALNPAGIVGLPEQFQIGAALFMPYRGYSSEGWSGESSSNIFLVPNMSYIKPIDATSSVGLTLYGNGGMNTDYQVGDITNLTPDCELGGGGVFCGGVAGVDLIQAFLSATYAHQMGKLKVGISPTFAIQRFAARGLINFGEAYYNLSSNSDQLTDNGYDWSYGGGLRAGLEYEVSKSVRLGISGQTKMYMTKFSKYAGLFAVGGDFDIPASVTAGIAVDASPDVTLMFDYQHIFYTGVPSVSNSSNLLYSCTPPTGPTCLGGSNGAGFGWHDVDVFKLGAEWRYDKQWTLRAGYAYSTNPVGSADVMFNILAPGIVQHHITGGVAYKLNDRSTMELSGMYVPEAKITGPNLLYNKAPEIEIHMHQYQFLVGWTYKM